MATASQIAKVKRDAGRAIAFIQRSDPTFDDTAIGDLIDEHNGNHFLSVAHVFEIAGASASERGSVSIGRYREDFSGQSDNFFKMSTWWKKKFFAAGFAGGLSKSDKQAMTDRVNTKLKVDIDKHPEAEEP